MDPLATLTIQQEIYGQLEDSIRVGISVGGSASALTLEERELLIARTLRAVAAIRGTRFDIAALEDELRSKLAGICCSLN